MRLIDADALKEMICNNVYPVRDYYFFNSQDYGMFWTGGIEKAIDEAPTIDAEPIRHGKWIYEPKDAIEMMFTKPKCSECGYESADGLHYCPNCGAKMDEVIYE